MQHKKNIRRSSFFKFKKIDSSDYYNVSFYRGWHELSIFRIEFLKHINGKNLLNKYIVRDDYGIEKALIISKGSSIIKKNKYFTKKLKKFDCLHTNKSFKNLEIQCKKGSQLFIIVGKRKISDNKKTIFFNFEKDLKKINLWGGQCISRVFHGHKFTLVLFRLKKGFQFHDKGHKNEQITWLIKGKMKFYVKHKNTTLEANKKSVDIGPFDFHGGRSFGAIGFDAFSPKRSENRYS